MASVLTYQPQSVSILGQSGFLKVGLFMYVAKDKRQFLLIISTMYVSSSKFLIPILIPVITRQIIGCINQNNETIYNYVQHKS